MFQVGTKLQFQTRSPTADEINNINEEFKIELTSLNEWNPESVQLYSISHQTSVMPFY